MNATILFSTFIVELCLGVCGFISVHLRSEARRRRLKDLPGWEQVPFKFSVDWSQDSDGKSGRSSRKLMKPRSRRV
jgi:hypothetical protein